MMLQFNRKERQERNVKALDLFANLACIAVSHFIILISISLNSMTIYLM